MFSEANKIQRERPPNVNLGGKEQTAAGSVAPVGFYQLSLTTRSVKFLTLLFCLGIISVFSYS